MAARIVAVVGPTAAGKTELAAEVALALDAEIVSVDSRQVFRRLDIGTAKPDRALRDAIPHHLIDVAEPDEAFDAARFAILGRAAIDDILARGRRVVLCGGSGLYLRALTEGLCAAPAADPALRAELDAELAERGPAAMHAELARDDPAAAARISSGDAARIRRALEVLRASGTTISEWQARHAFSDRPYDVATYVLSPPVELLDRRIAARSRAMWQGGLLEETAAVLAAGFSPDLAPLRAIGYREAQAHLRGELASERAVDAMTLATRRYAKRQRTWFRRLQDVTWLTGDEPAASVAASARAFLAGGGSRDA